MGNHNTIRILNQILMDLAEIFFESNFFEHTDSIGYPLLNLCAQKNFDSKKISARSIEIWFNILIVLGFPMCILHYFTKCQKITNYYKYESLF